MPTDSPDQQHTARTEVALAYIATADPSTIPTVNPSTGPADDVDVDQEPGFEEVEVAAADADRDLADPAVGEVA
jgi:hypothetical protein